MTARNLLHAARILAVALAALAAPAALADHLGDRAPRAPTHSVPEFDPAAGGALVALLAGGALLVANRRQSK
ncbi:MAG TPA: hypothetical protein VMU15_16755 [Anaeromyxobacter sp.]|nr:hypothetical protein [Anaeromyxobacter sp.]